MPSLVDQKKIPYLIVTPRYNPQSAGIRVLHLLCHSLNLLQESAYLAIYPSILSEKSQVTCPNLKTPLITTALLKNFEKDKLSPIVIYPETIRGNPLKATRVIRYMLNYPGLLGGDTNFPNEDIIYCYSRRIAQRIKLEENKVLFMPVSETAIFYPPLKDIQREGSCFYASKYQEVHQGKLFPITDQSFEITRFKEDSLSKEEIATLFRKSEVFYTYEDTALAIEAALCGCPTVFIPNAYLTEPLAFEELGMDGFAWGNEPEEFKRAKDTVLRVKEKYEALCQQYWLSLGIFINETQKIFTIKKYTGKIKLPEFTLLNLIIDTIKFIKRNGLKRFYYHLYRFLKKKGSFHLLLLLGKRIFYKELK